MTKEEKLQRIGMRQVEKAIWEEKRRIRIRMTVLLLERAPNTQTVEELRTRIYEGVEALDDDAMFEEVLNKLSKQA